MDWRKVPWHTKLTASVCSGMSGVSQLGRHTIKRTIWLEMSFGQDRKREIRPVFDVWHDAFLISHFETAEAFFHIEIIFSFIATTSPDQADCLDHHSSLMAP